MIQERIFALDIGTRSVVGLILEKNASTFQVIDIITREHDERSMVDGQIHDVLSVSNIINYVKEELEKKHGTLHKVCVAAAGRALKTKRTKVVKSITSHPLMDHEDVTHLELSAVQQAQHELAKEEADAKSTHYYCVGYSVLHYHLDGEDIGSLIDQQGEEASVEIIATFLPKVVVESLLSALQRAGLEMDALTLEPIAAINVLIPASMRRLNVALVDIGAGTSDIAITDMGTVTAYGMVPIAGDEITEAISDQYLLDFPLAEEAKRNLTTQEEITITDILGFETKVTYDDAISSISDSIDKLSNAIRDEILLLNNQAPKAVMLVGGGSLTPELSKRLANNLGLAENRVAIRGIDAIQSLEKTENLPEGPAFVTPVGIAIAAKQNPVHYISVQVNERTVRLFDMKTLTVGDCLLAAGIEMNKLYGKPGMALIVHLNKKQLTLPGNFGTSPTLEVNGVKSSLTDPIQNGDTITVQKGNDGQSPSYTLEELIGEVPSQSVFWNNQRFDLAPRILVNNETKSLNYVVQDHDQITFESISSIKDFFLSIEQEGILSQVKPFEIYVNNQKKKIKEDTVKLIKNEEKATIHETILHGDHIKTETESTITLSDLLEHLQLSYTYDITVLFNGQTIRLSKPQIKVFRNGERLEKEDKIYPNNQIVTEEIDVEAFIFQDIFRYVDVDISTTEGKQFKITKNGKDTTFFEPIMPGDKLELTWLTSHSSY